MWLVWLCGLDPDQDQQNVGPDLDPNHFDSVSIPKKMLWKSEFWKESAGNNKSM